MQTACYKPFLHTQKKRVSTKIKIGDKLSLLGVSKSGVLGIKRGREMAVVITSSQPDSIITRIDLVTSSVAVSKQIEI